MRSTHPRANCRTLGILPAACMAALFVSAGTTSAHAEERWDELIMAGSYQTAVNHFYNGQGSNSSPGRITDSPGQPGFTWQVYLRDYYNDEWRLNKVRDYHADRAEFSRIMYFNGVCLR